MSKHVYYRIEDKSYSLFNIKKVEIFGNHIFEKNEIIKKIKKTVLGILNTNNGVDCLIAYYYPTEKDMNNNIALCYVKLDKDIKNIELTDEKLYKKISWNEYYYFFSDAVKEEKISHYYNLFNKTNKMLKFIEKANSILHDLGTASNNTNLFEYEKIYECLEKWLITARYIDRDIWDLRPIVNNDFTFLIYHMNNILYHYWISNGDEITKETINRQLIINNEITNAIEKLELLRQQLVTFIIKHSTNTECKDGIPHFSKNTEEKEAIKYEKDNDSR